MVYAYPEQRVATTEAGRWDAIVERLSFAFQPIVNIHTGHTYGFEALLRNVNDAGFERIKSVFDTAHEERCLFLLNILLSQKAVKAFTERSTESNQKLFYNIDNRLLRSNDDAIQWTIDHIEEAGLSRHRISFEISERHELGHGEQEWSVLDTVRANQMAIALDDFGAGYSGLQLLYRSNPNLIKIDRFFIDEVDQDAKKKLFVSKLVTMAHTMGVRVVAEGVETAHEYLTCREIGCDLAQGYYIQPPTTEMEELHDFYPHVHELVKSDRRNSGGRQDLVQRQLIPREAVRPNSSFPEILKRFREDSIGFIPVVNEDAEPIGIIRERDLKRYVYSPFGISLLEAHAKRGTFSEFITRTPVAEIHTRIDTILNLYAADGDSEAVLITENGVYRGVLDSHSLLHVLNARELAQARDQNPLSKLPGNTIINEYVSEKLHDTKREQMFAYLDFNHFKPFNDTFGFRLGDRALVMFADMLKELSHRENVFVGHVGGDDFFVGLELETHNRSSALNLVWQLATRFSENAASFYSEEDRNRGYVLATDRDGNPKPFPLLSLSTAVVFVRTETTGANLDDLSRLIATLKQRAKRSKRQLAYRTI